MRSFLFLLLAVSPAASFAQAVVQPLPGSTDADQLGATMRRVAANPRDVDALLTAGEQSLKVDDLAGAASLFARAEKIEPRNGRVKAGMAAILVRSERPGEALRYFNQAAAAGLDPRRFAADRGLAYDLIGEQERAQRDYRLALQSGGNDETIRRYALSLGIVGRREEALKQLDPLLGKTDRAAWRARAFVLAMAGDQAEAERIASTMMPGGMAQGLLPFFRRLPSLPAADRAFAVHFGEVRPTPERLADARLIPQLTPITPEPRPVALAAVTTPTSSGTSNRRSDRRSRRDRPGREALDQIAAVPSATVRASPTQIAGLGSIPAQMRALPVPARAVTPAASSLPATPSVQPGFAPVLQSQVRTALVPAPTAVAVAGSPVAPGFSSSLVPAPRDVAATPVVAASSITPVSPGTPTPTAIVATVTSSAAPTSVAAPGAVPVTNAPASSAAATNVVASVAGPPAPAAKGASASMTNPSPGVAVMAVTPSTATPSTVTLATAPQPTPVAAASPLPAASVAEQPATPTATVPTEVARTVRPAAPTLSRGDADAVLARIVASLSIPAEELGVTGPTRPVAVPLNDGAARTAEAVRVKTARDAEVDAAAAKLAARTRAADRKAAAEKLVAEKKLAAEKKAAADKIAEERRIARTNPPRIWVQVAGGANERDLAKAWSATKAKAPKVLGDRSGWTTPLRATNRVLTGPFKTDAEARGFVNQLSKAGVSAFTFTSEAGQSVTRLSAK
jgi:Flp pilus assembly protein TadD